MEIKLICRRSFGSQTKQIGGISSCCFAWDGSEMYKVLKRTSINIFSYLQFYLFGKIKQIYWQRTEIISPNPNSFNLSFQS